MKLNVEMDQSLKKRKKIMFWEFPLKKVEELCLLFFTFKHPLFNNEIEDRQQNNIHI